MRDFKNYLKSIENAKNFILFGFAGKKTPSYKEPLANVWRPTDASRRIADASVTTSAISAREITVKASNKATIAYYSFC